jgi:hypothetical protein
LCCSLHIALRALQLPHCSLHVVTPTLFVVCFPFQTTVVVVFFRIVAPLP